MDTELCRHGHELNDKNLYVSPKGQRGCRECNRQAVARYQKRNIPLVPAAGRRLTLAERFWPKVDKRGPDECWPWLGRIKKGTGRAMFVSVSAAQIALIVSGKPRPSGEHGACHTCDNPACVNPAHLWWGTQKDNMSDCLSKGRNPMQGRFKSHCKYGHPFSGSNVYVARGQRWCIECRRRRLREQRAKLKEKRNAWA